MLKLKIATTIFAVTLFASCKKESVQNKDKIVVTQLSSAEVDAHYSDYYPHTNGSFFIWTENYKYLNRQNAISYSNYLSISGGFFINPQDTIAISGGPLIIDTIALASSPGYGINKNDLDSNFYGRDITISMMPPTGQAPPFIATIYLPKAMYAQMGNAILNSNIQTQSDTLFWNADPNNKNGVDVGEVGGVKYTTGIADNGMYILPKSAYANLASGSSTNFFIGRRSYLLVTYNQFKYIIKAYCYTPILGWKVP